MKSKIMIEKVSQSLLNKQYQNAPMQKIFSLTKEIILY